MTKPQHKNIQCINCRSTSHESWANVRDIEYNTSTEVFNYRHCKDCDCLFISDPPVDRLSEIYPDNYYSYDENSMTLLSRIKEHLDNRTFRKLCNGLGEGPLSALDIGGGTGSALTALRKNDDRFNYSAVVDLDERAEKIAKQKGHEYFRGRFEDQSFERRFDLILLLNLIEHVAEPAVLLDTAERVLNQRGRILIKTPNWRSLDHDLFRHRNWAGFHCPRHWCLWTKDSFESLVSNSGLAVDKMWYTQGAPFWAASILGLSSFSKSRQKPLVSHMLFPPLAGLFASVDMVRGILQPLSQMYFILRKA